MMNNMTDEMIDVAHDLFNAAEKYRELFERENGSQPVIWLAHDATGESVFIADSFNSNLIRSRL